MSGFVRFLSGWRKWFPKPFSATTRPETEEGPRPIKAGLGDQESDVSGGRRGVKKASLPSSKRGRSAVSECPTFSDFCGADNEDVSQKQEFEDITTNSIPSFEKMFDDATDPCLQVRNTTAQWCGPGTAGRPSAGQCEPSPKLLEARDAAEIGGTQAGNAPGMETSPVE